jgi:hypothetical protein
MEVNDILSRIGPITISEEVEEKPTCCAMDVKQNKFCGDTVGENDKHLCDKHHNAYLEMVRLNNELKAKEKEKKDKIDHKNKTFEEQYKILKENFEKDVKMIGAKFMKIINEDEVWYGKQDMATILENKFIETEDENGKKIKTKFFKVWLEDSNRQHFDKVDFYPTDECPSNVYNKFDGLRASKLNFDMTPSAIAVRVKPIIDHINLLTSGHSDFMIKWLANIVQNTHKKSEVALLLRDQGTLTTCGGGTGKNLFFEWFGNKILGEKYFITVGNNSDLFDNFNGLFENKLLVFVEEAKSDDNNKNIDYLKSQITGKKSKTERKGVDSYSTKNFTNYVFTSNNRNPIPINKNDRRFSAYDVNISKRNNSSYFENLVSKLDEDLTAYAFYKYLMSIKTYKSPVEFQQNIPITNALIEMKILNSGPLIRWIVYLLIHGKVENMTTSNLYNLYIDWTQRNREGSEKAMSLTAFGSQLTNDKDIGALEAGEKEKTRVGMFWTWNVEKMVSNLKKLRYLPDTFIYKQSQPTIEDSITKSELTKI